MPIIDLTATEDVEQQVCQENSSRPTIESNKTPPLDMNGNEILITTNTKTMQPITYTVPRDLNVIAAKHSNIFTQSASSQQQRTKKQTSKTAVSSTAFSTPDAPPVPLVLTKSGHRIPIKEQIKITTKYNRWVQENRVRNGFRLFVCQNIAAAQNHALKSKNKNKSKAKLNAQEVLWYWWNSIPPSEQEQYAKIAEILLKKKSLATHSPKNDAIVELNPNASNVSRSSEHSDGKMTKVKKTNKNSGNDVSFDKTTDSPISLRRKKP